MIEITREMMQKSLPSSYKEKCERCGHNRWTSFKDAPTVVMCTRCFFVVEDVLEKK